MPGIQIAPRSSFCRSASLTWSSLLEGLQDSVHRESERQGKRIAELEARMQPGALGEAMSKDARDRGL